MSICRLVSYSDTDSSDVDQESTNTEPLNTRSKKRKRCEHNWKRVIAKNKRLKGEGYQSAVSYKMIKKRDVGNPCNCKMNCSNRISKDDRLNIFQDFWKISSWDQRRQYVSSLVDVYPVKRQRVENDIRQRNRASSRTYYLMVGMEKVKVCRVMFLNTFNITAKFVGTVLKKKISDSGSIISPDQRGRHVPANKTDPIIINHIRDHIGKFPRYESHYTREKTQKHYLGPELNIVRMYKLYLEDCQQNNIPEAMRGKEWLYRKIFNEDFNLSFHLPYNDTCDDCDSLLMAEKNEKSLEKRTELLQQKKKHLEEANLRYAFKREDSNRGKNSKLLEEVLTIDMQKCLPTPSLTNGRSFYLRKLWVLNETIHSNSTGKSYAMMWDETKAGRGGNEVGSSIFHWITQNLNPNTEILTIWTDNCTGQNRNSTIILTYFWIMHKFPQIKEINHKFLLKGHTHMEVDSVHSTIERAKKQMGHLEIIIPRDWEHLVRTSRRNNPITVHPLQINDFKNFNSLSHSNSSPFVLRKTNNDREPFKISEVVWLKVESDSIGTVFYKTSFNDLDFKELNLLRSKRRNIQFPLDLPPIRDGRKPVNTEKYKNLMELLKWIPTEYHDYYKSIPHSSNVPLTGNSDS